MIAAWCNKKILAPMTFKYSADTELFNTWFEKILLPELKPNQTIILDNYSIHKSEQTQKLAKQAKCKIIFLPPYSPDLNPIEKSWANIKTTIKKIVKSTKTFNEAVDIAILQYCEN